MNENRKRIRPYAIIAAAIAVALFVSGSIATSHAFAASPTHVPAHDKTICKMMPPSFVSGNPAYQNPAYPIWKCFTNPTLPPR